MPLMDGASPTTWSHWLLGAVAPVAWLVAIGAVALLFFVARAVGGARKSLARFGPCLGLGGAIAVALVSFVGLALHGKCFDVPGIGSVWSLDDDMMITLRYARNAAAGAGLVWNPGEHVEGITNFLWALILVVPHWFLAQERVALAAIVLNGALLVAALALTFRLVRAFGGSSFAATLASLALATHQATLHWAAGGSEALLLSVLLLILANVAVRADGGATTTTRTRALAALVGGLALLTRPDAAPVAVALLASWQLPSLRRRDGWLTLGLFLLLPLALLLSRIEYYGSPFPNTYYLKMTRWPGRMSAGFDYLWQLLSHHGLFVLLACAALLAARRRAALFLLAAVLVQLGYVAYAGGDELPKYRFFVPIAPLTFALAFTGIEQLAHRIGGARGPVTVCESSRCQPIWLPCTALLAGGIGGGFLPGTIDPTETSRSTSERATVMEGYLVRANTEPDALVAHFWAGAAAYFSNRAGVDFLGKCDPVIAHEEAKPGLDRPGHNKYDFGHSLALKPDVILGGLGGEMTLRKLNLYVKESPYRAFADLYFENAFASDYVGTSRLDVGKTELMHQLVGGAGSTLDPAYADVSRRFHAIFVRRDSTRAKPPAQWTAPSRENLK